MIIGLDHLQLAIPLDGEEQSRAFWIDTLHLTEIAKPAALSGRGGLWLEGAGIHIHLGVETPFLPAKKAHPAFEVASLDDLKSRLSDANWPCTTDADLPGITRIFTADPFGNRIEFLQKT